MKTMITLMEGNYVRNSCCNRLKQWNYAKTGSGDVHSRSAHAFYD